MSIKSLEKNYCDCCDYTTSKSYDYSKHLLTAKHKKNEKMDKLSIKMNKKVATDFQTGISNSISSENNINNISVSARSDCVHFTNKGQKRDHKCEKCNKQFNNYNALWKHKNRKSCESIETPNDSENKHNTITKSPTNPIINDLFMEFLKQNKELQNALIEQNKEHSKQMMEITKNQSMVNCNNNNTTNQQFNLQFFLNETCKDAMNITDFVNSLQLKMEDFEETGKIGFVEGISRIIINGLKQVDSTKRPIHCTDVKRETVYIKHDDSWEKEDQNKDRLKQAVSQVAKMNLCQLPKWQKLNPESAIIDTVQNEEYIQYSIAALGGRTTEEDNKYMDKIMKNVLKEVFVDKGK